jgi:hypothetical protein
MSIKVAGKGRAVFLLRVRASFGVVVVMAMGGLSNVTSEGGPVSMGSLILS